MIRRDNSFQDNQTSLGHEQLLKPKRTAELSPCIAIAGCNRCLLSLVNGYDSCMLSLVAIAVCYSCLLQLIAIAGCYCGSLQPVAIMQWLVAIMLSLVATQSLCVDRQAGQFCPFVCPIVATSSFLFVSDQRSNICEKSFGRFSRDSIEKSHWLGRKHVISRGEEIGAPVHTIETHSVE